MIDPTATKYFHFTDTNAELDQLQEQWAQMNEFFAQFAQYTKQSQPCSAMTEGGTH